MRLKDNFHIFAIISIFFWSSAHVFTRLALRYFTPLSLGFLRNLIASFSSIIIIFFFKTIVPKRTDIKWLVLAGFFGFFLYIILYNIGYTTVTASTGSLLSATIPIITTVMARIIYKEKLHLIQYIAMIIEFSGIAVITLMNSVFSINFGIVFLLSACILYSIYNLLLRKLTKTYPAIQTSIITIWIGTIMLLMLLPDSIVELKSAPPVQMVYILILGIFPTAIATITWTLALSKAKNASSASNYMLLTPFLATIGAVFLAKEIPDRSTLIGGAIIVVGMVLYNFFGMKALRVKQ